MMALIPLFGIVLMRMSIDNIVWAISIYRPQGKDAILWSWREERWLLSEIPKVWEESLASMGLNAAVGVL